VSSFGEITSGTSHSCLSSNKKWGSWTLSRITAGVLRELRGCARRHRRSVGGSERLARVGGMGWRDTGECGTSTHQRDQVSALLPHTPSHTPLLPAFSRTHRYCLHSPAHTTSHLSAFIFFYVASLLSADASRAIKRPCRHTAAVIPSGST
jgi:hypothetical protein